MPQSLRLGGVPEHFNLPFRLLEEGTCPINFTWTDYPGGTGALCKALAESELDVAIVLSEGITAFKAKGGQAIVPAFWVQTPLIWGIHTGAQSPYHTIADLKGKPFAISRPGSGSQLMAFLLAQREGWTQDSVKFVEVGNLAGATAALTHIEAAGFLWERFMTHPLVANGTFRRLGELPTPWPAFAIAVRPNVWETRQDDVRQLIKFALDNVQKLTPQLIASRYGLTEDQAAQWLSLTHWASPYQEGIDDQLADIEQTLRQVGAL
jgi:DNA-binding transcriptional LysR family regulator